MTPTALSTQKAQYGTAGVRSEGSPMEVMLDTQVQAKRAQNRTTYWAGRAKEDIKKWSSINVAELIRSGQMAKTAGRMAMYGGFLGGTASGIEEFYSYGKSAGLFGKSKDSNPGGGRFSFLSE